MGWIPGCYREAKLRSLPGGSWSRPYNQSSELKTNCRVLTGTDWTSGAAVANAMLWQTPAMAVFSGTHARCTQSPQVAFNGYSKSLGRDTLKFKLRQLVLTSYSEPVEMAEVVSLTKAWGPWLVHFASSV